MRQDPEEKLIEKLGDVGMPVTHEENGVVMLSGYSAELLKCVLDAKEFTPMSMMKHVLEPYSVPIEVSNCQVNQLSNPIDITHLETAIKKSEIKEFKQIKPILIDFLKTYDFKTLEKF